MHGHAALTYLGHATEQHKLACGGGDRALPELLQPADGVPPKDSHEGGHVAGVGGLYQDG